MKTFTAATASLSIMAMSVTTAGAFVTPQSHPVFGGATTGGLNAINEGLSHIAGFDSSSMREFAT